MRRKGFLVSALTAVLLSASILSMLPVADVISVEAAEEGETFTYGDFTCAYLEDGTVEISKYNGNDAEVVIPEEINGCMVTRIGESAFYHCGCLENVTIAPNVTEIGVRAFYWCTNLESITIPKSVIKIGAFAFGYDLDLEEVVGGENVTEVGENAFYNTLWLKRKSKEKVGLVWGTYLGKAFIRTMSGDYSENVMSGVVDMGDGMKRGGSYVELPDETIMLIEGGYETSEVVSSKVISAIGDYGCNGYDFVELSGIPESWKIPEGTEYIGTSAFGGGYGSYMKEITMPSTLRVVGSYVFYTSGWKNVGIASIQLNDGLETIEAYAFYDCRLLTEIMIPASVIKIGNKALGYYEENDPFEQFDEKVENFTIYGYSGTVAETYALENGFIFISLDEEETYVLDLSTGNTVVSAEMFATLLEENQTKTVIIKANDDVTFTFQKGEMKAVEGKDSYDFAVDIYRDFASVTGVPSDVNEDNFVFLADYHYSGQLPAKADIRLYAGTNYAGKTLYYNSLSDDANITLVSTITVDEEGYITVKQDHCSRYLLTSEAVSGNEASATGDIAGHLPYILLSIVSTEVMIALKRRKRA